MIKATGGWTYEDIDRLGIHEFEQVLEHVVGLRIDRPAPKLATREPPEISRQEFEMMVAALNADAAARGQGRRN